MAHGKLHGNGHTQRAPEVDDARRVHVLPGLQVAQGGLGVAVQALLGGGSGAVAVAAVVEDEDVDAELAVEQVDVRQAVANVAAVAVVPEQRHVALSRHVPPVQPPAVIRLEVGRPRTRCHSPPESR